MTTPGTRCPGCGAAEGEAHVSGCPHLSWQLRNPPAPAPAPTPVDALIARLRQVCVETRPAIPLIAAPRNPGPCGYCERCRAAAALAAQQERIAELEQCQVGAFSTLGEDALRGVISHNKAAYTAMQDRAERAEARVKELGDANRELLKRNVILNDRLVDCEAALRQAEADARRYRWCRANWHAAVKIVPLDDSWKRIEALDARIDAAIDTAQGGKS